MKSSEYERKFNLWIIDVSEECVLLITTETIYVKLLVSASKIADIIKIFTKNTEQMCCLLPAQKPIEAWFWTKAGEVQADEDEDISDKTSS